MDLVGTVEDVPWGIRPGEYCGLWDTLSLDEQVYTRFRITQLEQSGKGQVILPLLH